jgi:MinD superfamily P-loop ATPase
MIITIASGKGGTGKTTFAVNLAYVLAHWNKTVRLLDCDVEEPDDHLFVKPDLIEEKEVTVLKPVWDESRCTGCGKCAEACNYNAIAIVNEKVLIFNELCHSCGVCSFVCPEKALIEKECVIGAVQAAPGNKPFFFAHGLLNIGEALAPKVVCAVKKYIDSNVINILDASPGTSCSVVKAVEGADVAVMVTEPTPFGLNDLKLAVSLSLKMKVPTGIVINRSDGEDGIISEYAKSIGVPVVGRIPFKREYAETYSAGHILVKWHEELKSNLLNIYDRICALKETVVPVMPDKEAFCIDEGDVLSLPKGNASSCREVTIVSGKGGTGKTTVLGSFAVLAENMILADNDVDAADLHLILLPTILEEHDFTGGQKALIDPDKCAACGRCADACHYNAIHFDGPASDVIEKTYKIDALACEGCGFCSIVCPANAVSMHDNISGQWHISNTSQGPMAHARLGIAEENSGRLVTKVRDNARRLTDDLKKELILADGPPGTGCPVIASISGTDLVVIVTEPTVSGVHDMERVFKLTEHFDVPALVIINKSDLNTEQSARIKEISEQNGSKVIAEIPFDRNVNDALIAGTTVIEYGKCNAEEAIRRAWTEIQKELNNK